jgi:hypothetical protein
VTGELSASAAAEWDALVTTAIVGTDRHRLPPPGPGWDTWATDGDDAVALLDRAAAVVAARRAGVVPAPPLSGLEPAPDDPRPPCPPACAVRLDRILRGEHEGLLGEWFERCESIGARLPWTALPTLLARGRRNPQLDLSVRRLAGPRAAWLAATVPELGVAVTPPRAAAAVEPLASAPRAPDSGALVAAVLGTFDDRTASWAAAAQLRAAVATLDPEWLPRLVASLSAVGFHPAVERTRAELIGFAEFRHALHVEFGPPSATAPA